MRDWWLPPTSGARGGTAASCRWPSSTCLGPLRVCPYLLGADPTVGAAVLLARAACRMALVAPKGPLVPAAACAAAPLADPPPTPQPTHTPPLNPPTHPPLASITPPSRAGLFNCPLAMTDGAACLCEALLAASPPGAPANGGSAQRSGEGRPADGALRAVLAEALRHLTSQDPVEFWTSGQASAALRSATCTGALWGPVARDRSLRNCGWGVLGAVVGVQPAGACGGDLWRLPASKPPAALLLRARLLP